MIPRQPKPLSSDTSQPRLPNVQRTVAVGGAGDAPDRVWGIVEEVPVEIGVNGRPFAVTMASPSNLTDLAVGFGITEGLIVSASDVTSVAVESFWEGITADLAVPDDKIQTQALRRRSLDGRTGCGLCGVERLVDAVKTPAQLAETRPVVGADAISRAFRALPQHQPLNRATRTAHAAAWCDLDGFVQVVREDVGRHNALDKLVGAILLREGGSAPGFVVLSSRCSYELVAKAAHCTPAILASASAPTGLAIDIATQLNLPLATVGSDESVIRFAGSSADG